MPQSDEKQAQDSGNFLEGLTQEVTSTTIYGNGDVAPLPLTKFSSILALVGDCVYGSFYDDADAIIAMNEICDELLWRDQFSSTPPCGDCCCGLPDPAPLPEAREWFKDWFEGWRKRADDIAAITREVARS